MSVEAVEKACLGLEVVFSHAERLFLNQFSRVAKDGEVGYGSAVIKSGSKEYREGVLRYMGFVIRLMENEYWGRKLRFDKERLEFERVKGQGRY